MTCCEDRRLLRIWTFGGIGTIPRREQTIRARTDWPFVLCQAPAVVRSVYEFFCHGWKPESDIHCVLNGVEVSVSREWLLRLWRVDRRRLTVGAYA